MNANNKSGGILVVVMLIMVVISILTVGMFKLYEADAVEAVYVDKSSQAFWLAESGMQRALDKLRTDNSYRNSPYVLSETVGSGSYAASVAIDAYSNSTWNIVATGTVGNVSRILTLDPYLFAEVGYALMSLDGDGQLDRNGTIDDDVYCYGTLDANGRFIPNINGEVNALDTDNIDYTPLTGNDKVEMEINAPITNFTGYTPTSPIPTTNVVYNGSTNTYIDLTGGDVVVAGDYDWNSSTIPYVEGTFGSGTLIVDGDLTIKNGIAHDFVIGDGGHVYVDGNISAGKDGDFGENVVLYTTGDMDLQKAAGADSTTFLIEGDLKVNMDLNFNGLIFCEGFVRIEGNMDLSGSLIAGSGFWIKGDYNIEYDGGQIPQAVLDNMIVYVTYATKPGTWNEMPAF